MWISTEKKGKCARKPEKDKYQLNVVVVWNIYVRHALNLTKRMNYENIYENIRKIETFSRNFFKNFP